MQGQSLRGRENECPTLAEIYKNVLRIEPREGGVNCTEG